MKHNLDSANIEKFEWAKETLTLFFKDGSVFNYLKVPMVVAAGLSTAKSAGSFLIQYVKGNYEYVKIKDSNVDEQLKRLSHHEATTVGLWATDKPECIPDEIKHLFFQITKIDNEPLSTN